MSEEAIVLEVGDVVGLKSGGPRMTVIGVVNDSDPQKVHCAWFDEGGQHHLLEDIDAASLERFIKGGE